MTVTFQEDKACKIYEDFVSNPTERLNIKKFQQKFGNNILSSAVRLHTRVLAASNAKDYNQIAGHNNKIEKLQGEKDKEAQTFKLRIDQSYRKFFYHYSNDCYCLVKDWNNNFEGFTHMHIYDINNHEY
ncbi:MAG: hypothetical protein LBV71_06325 [Prevotella sp.]|jgi:hypothetical protein|nr:hypothetical protein [Prevotella sp.]